MPDTEEHLKKIKERRGYLLPTHEFIVKEDPDYIEDYERFIQGLNAKTKAFTPKEKELILVAVNCNLNYLPGLKTHMTWAFNLGATKAEVLETIEVAGVHRPQALTIGIKMLVEVLEEIGGKGG